MKKLISVLLAAIMLVSCFGVMAFAEGEETAYVYVSYLVVENGEVVEATIGPKQVTKGQPIPGAEMEAWLFDMPREFSDDYQVTEDGYTRTETKTYTFKGFTKKGDESGQLYYFGSTDEITEDTVFVAQYKIEDTIEFVTFWELVQSIFARINRIFEYFAEIFKF
ncbi:MAG: hypothetical protein IJ962_04590 [Clostridia bacterium]|nr:hypothetical protein [Clostridia bacterium]MBR2418744.1 hypothetical protein [Clostridia bacterium]